MASGPGLGGGLDDHPAAGAGQRQAPAGPQPVEDHRLGGPGRSPQDLSSTAELIRGTVARAQFHAHGDEGRDPDDLRRDPARPAGEEGLAAGRNLVPRSARPVLGSLLAGASVAIDPGFSPFGFWERTRTYRAAAFTFVGSVLTLLYNRPPRPDDRDNPVRRAVGAATPLWMWEAFERRFGVEIVETYGQTEMFSIWFVNPPDARKVGTVGTPAGDRFEARIADPETGAPLPPESRGEIAIRPSTPSIQATGYFKDPETSASAWRPDGWYYTGDLGTRDADGYYRYVGRLKDCIRRRGENIAAYEIEVVVNAHPKVLESAAVGVPSPLGEEEVKLCVIPRPQATLDPGELLAYCRAELPAFMVPRYIQLRESLPKTATERVQKAALREEGTIGCWQPGRPL